MEKGEESGGKKKRITHLKMEKGKRGIGEKGEGEVRHVCLGTILGVGRGGFWYSVGDILPIQESAWGCTS